MGSSDHFDDIFYVYSSVYNRIGIPIHKISSTVIPGTDLCQSLVLPYIFHNI